MRGKWWVALLALIVFPVGMAVLSGTLDKRYTASMRLLVDQTQRGYDAGASPFQPFDDASGASRPRSIETTVNVLTGTDVLGDAIMRTANKFPKAFEGGQLSDKYESLIRRLSVDSGPLSDVITIRVTMDNPEIAAEVANNVAYAYIDYTRKLEGEAGNSALTMIDKALKTTKEKLDKIDTDVSAIKREYNISDATASNQYAAQGYAQMESRVSELEGLYNSARSELSVSEQILGSTEKMVVTGRTVQMNPALVELETNKTRLEVELAGLRQKYFDDAEQVMEYQKRLQSVNKQINSIKRNVDAQTSTNISPNYQQAQLNVAGNRTKVAALEQQLNEARTNLDTLKTKINALPEAEKKLSNLLRQRMILENSLAQLDQRKEIIDSTGSGRKNPARVVSTALPPSVPSFPDTRLFTLIGLAIGFVVAALIVMPKGDTDLYGQWPQGSKPLKARRGDRGTMAASSPAERPALDNDPLDDTDSTVS